MFAEAVKETCFHLTLCPCENQKVAWNLFSNGISPSFECDWFGSWGRMWRLCSALRFSLRCAIVSCSCENIQPFIEEFLQIFTSVLQEKRWGWRKGPRGGSAALLFHSLQQNCPRHYYEALRCVWELEIILTSWENCCERISGCSTAFIAKMRRTLRDAGECYSSLSLIQAFKVEDSNLAISLDKLGCYYWSVLFKWGDQTGQILSADAEDAKRISGRTANSILSSWRCCHSGHVQVINHIFSVMRHWVTSLDIVGSIAAGSGLGGSGAAVWWEQNQTRQTVLKFSIGREVCMCFHLSGEGVAVAQQGWWYVTALPVIYSWIRLIKLLHFQISPWLWWAVPCRGWCQSAPTSLLHTVSFAVTVAFCSPGCSSIPSHRWHCQGRCCWWSCRTGSGWWEVSS